MESWKMKVTDGRILVREGDPWESVTFEGAEMAALRIGARMTFRERLQWLEQATRVAQALVRSSPQQIRPTISQPRKRA